MDLGSDWYGKEVRFSEEPPSHQSSTQHLLPHRVCGLGNKVLGSHQVTVSLFITNFDQFCRGNVKNGGENGFGFNAKMLFKGQAADNSSSTSVPKARAPAFHLPPLTTVQKCPTVVANTNRAGDEPHQERISLPLHCAGKVSAAKPHFKHLGSVGRQAALKTPWLCLTSCSTLNAKTSYLSFAKMFSRVPACHDQ